MSDLGSLPTASLDSIILTKVPAISGKGGAQLKEACLELESLFVYYLLKEMRATIPKSGFISGGKAEEIYTSMLDLQLARELSFRGGIGLSPLLIDQLYRKPEDMEGQNIKK